MAQYDDAFIERLELVWGEGFLSPGGPEEVGDIVRGLDLAGRRVLDIGCGTGGPAVVLARDMGAEVVGIDIEAGPLARAARHVETAALGERVTLRRVEPGPLPFDDAAFDVVFSKDSLLHVADRPGMFAEIARVLVPGGALAASDWFAGVEGREHPALRAYLDRAHLEIAPATALETMHALQAAGFTRVRMRDRAQWFEARIAEENRALEGRLRPDLERIMGPEGAEEALAVRRALGAAASARALRPAHIRATLPG
jgi:phosphoethanolamine N-methyltransferase